MYANVKEYFWSRFDSIFIIFLLVLMYLLESPTGGRLPVLAGILMSIVCIIEFIHFTRWIKATRKSAEESEVGLNLEER